MSNPNLTRRNTHQEPGSNARNVPEGGYITSDQVNEVTDFLQIINKELESLKQKSSSPSNWEKSYNLFIRGYYRCMDPMIMLAIVLFFVVAFFNYHSIIVIIKTKQVNHAIKAAQQSQK
ncbi:hypothetical protein DFJ63DRAFT_315231 [Scheffersomyces coipomensis]|uniref:uncharacterized protein n=1 Tax=Scheffersomyces coipomensis TaxID=1788519 RepID=UPI00315DCB13